MKNEPITEVMFYCPNCEDFHSVSIDDLELDEIERAERNGGELVEVCGSCIEEHLSHAGDDGCLCGGGACFACNPRAYV